MVGGGSGVELVSWCLMGNHFHLLVRVPPLDAEALSDEEVFSCMEHIYEAPRMRHFRGVWERMNNEVARSAFLAPFRGRMGNLSDFVKTLKQRFSQWFNIRNNREGTLWEGRFHSVMLAHNENADGEGLGLLARFVAEYIDLNPVRAGLVRDAGESGWSGYGAALRGDVDGLQGMRLLWGEKAVMGLDRSGVFELHEELLARARFRDREREEKGDESEDSRASQRTRHLERTEDREKGTPVDGAFDESSSAKMLEPSRSASRVLERMGERCEALTRGWALGGNWLLSQSA